MTTIWVMISRGLNFSAPKNFPSMAAFVSIVAGSADGWLF
eukprot:CAMPEP_0172887680 /NCGR_PEP_ID=MMETSP1075-20121228/134551_1 /TAXON_ID=2916 /ORGANISM="Ceratium fusus, Strain PA161109" /LENGTH=39 /DNA_ID= /DNA_START= /DNA_END= /DNA_ORIENTATION=